MLESNVNEQFSLNNVHTVVRRALLSSGNMTSMTTKFGAFDSNAERVYFAYDILKDHNLLPNLINVEKCDEKSEERRKYGNHLFIALKKDHNAMKMYNKSIAYAKTKETLALAYGNRSAIFFGNKLYNECLKDIEYAFENGYPEHLHKKLNERKLKAEQQLTEQIHKNEEYFTSIPEIKGTENETIECASDCIEMQHTENMGRHITATRKIQPGDVIAVEKPFTNILLHEFYLTHCHHCLRPSYNLLPCEKCPLTLYCSNSCRKQSWRQYHRFECTLLDTLHSIDATKLHLLALRVVLCEFSQPNGIQSETKKYKSQSYKEIHNLVTNEKQRPVQDLFARSLVAAVVLHLLDWTSLFEELNGNDLVCRRGNVAGLILRHLQTAPSNMHEISEMQGTENNGYTILEVGAGAYAFMSLLNHSCDPNVVRHCHGTTIILRALRPIEIGQQLFDNYGYHHALMSRDDRKAHLKEQYFFTCECQACVEDWPLYEHKNISEGNANFIVSEEELNALTNGSREMADNLMPRLIQNAKNLETSEHRKCTETLENQEILKQCFAICGNKHTIF